MGNGKCCIVYVALMCILRIIRVTFEFYSANFFLILLSNNNFESERGQWGLKILKVFKLLAEILASTLRTTKS